MASAICFNLDQAKILSSGNGLNTIQSINRYVSIFVCRIPQWSDDEQICARNVNNELHFYEGGNFGK